MKNFLSKTLSLLTVFSMTFSLTFAQTIEAPNVDIKIEKSSEVSVTKDVKKDDSEKESKEEAKEDVKEEVKDESNGEVAGAENTNTTPESSPEEEPVVQRVIDVVNSCDTAENLVSNGGFEYPVVTSPNGWDIYDDGTPGLDWTVEWRDDLVGPLPDVAKLELQRGVNGWTSDEGLQHAELDADFGYATNEEASVKISQDIVTVSGRSYTLSYAFSPRPGTPEGENYLKIFVDGVHADTHSTGAHPAGNTSWTTYTHNFVATGAVTNISFQDAGYPNAVGTFLDDVKVNCIEDIVIPDVCDVEENIIENGSFEYPINTDNPNFGNGAISGNWKVYKNGNVPNWSVEWINPANLPEIDPRLEIQKIWHAKQGTQYAELDSDFEGPSGPALLEDASTKITQTLYNTIPGQNYEVSFWVSPRPGTVAADNTVSSYIDGIAKITTPAIAGVTTNNVWKEYKYTFKATNITTDISFADAGTSNALGSFLDNIKVNCTDSQEEPEEITLVVNKIVCTYEEDLPNYGNGGPNITPTTAADWVASHQNCHLVDDWQFEWAPYNTPNPGDSLIGNAGGVWTSFVSSVNIPMPSGTENDTKLWVREVLPEGYIPFTFGANGDTNIDNVSAEIYCHTDVLNYDNYERLDDISAGNTYNCVAWNVPLEPEGPSCDSNEIWARIFIDFQNAGVGDMTGDIYVGNNSSPINSGDWFMVHDGTNYVNDPTLFEDVPGLAVQRLNGKVLLGIHGSHPGTQGAIQESVDGYIEFFNGNVTSVNDDSGQNKLEAGGLHPDVISFASDKSYFNLGVNTADDFYYANYEYQVDEDCEDDDQEEVDCEINCEEECQNDCEEEENNITFCHVPPGNSGNPQTLTLPESAANNAHLNNHEDDYPGVCQNVVTQTNNPTSGGGSSSSGSRISSGGAVLGASTGEVLGACTQFTEYHRKGDVGGEVAKIQEFLNEHMNAGITVDGVYGETTVKAVHAFQEKYFEQVISPWVPSFMARTTGKFYKTTRMMVNKIIDCPEAPVFLEDPKIIYEVKWEKPQTN